MKLFYSLPSPFARKVRVAIRELGLLDRVQEVEVTVAPHQPNEAFGRTNPLIKVPALETDDGMVLFNSPVLCEYLDVLAGGNRLMPAQGKPRWDALRRQALGDGVTDAGILRRYELVPRPENLRWDDWLKGQQRKIDLGLDDAEREAGGWGKRFDVGDMAIACALGWLSFRFPDYAWRKTRPKLAAWFEQVDARPSMQETKPRA